jgi:putative membrane protein
VKQLSIALAIAGLVLGVGLVAWTGAGSVAHAVLSVGLSGFALYVGYQLVLVTGLGLCWLVLVPDAVTAQLPPYVFGRMVRDAAGQFLPFSQVGGIVLGARTVTLFGVAWPMAIASTLADVTVEFIGQMVFAFLGLLVLLSRAPHSELILPLALGIGAALVLTGVFVMAQQGAASLVRRLSDRFGAHWIQGLAGRVDQVQDGFDVIYRRPLVLALGAAMHLLTWFGTAGASWLAFHLMGARIDYPAALAIEALLHAGLTLTFIVPGAAGVQELFYTSLGALFGVPPEVSLAVSLLRRARDLAIAVPVLLGWQFLEARRLRVR